MYEIVLLIGVKRGKVAAPARPGSMGQGSDVVIYPHPPEDAGWTAGKIVAIVLALLGLVAGSFFGLCSVYVATGTSGGGIVTFALLAIAGFGVAAACLVTIVRVIAKARGKTRRD